MLKARMSKALAIAAATSAMAVGGVVVAPHASATPTGCYAYVAGNGGYARCSGGTGYVRVLVACGTGNVYGPWEPPNKNSIVFCSGAIAAGYQTTG